MRFLADMGISLRIVAWLRAAGHDVADLREQGSTAASGCVEQLRLGRLADLRMTWLLKKGGVASRREGGRVDGLTQPAEGALDADTLFVELRSPDHDAA